MNRWELSKVAHACEEHLGMEIRQVFDPAEIKSILSQLEKGYISPILDPAKNDFTPASGFWLVAEKNGRPMIAGGVRCDDLGCLSIKDFWRQSLRRAFGQDPAPVTMSFPDEDLSGRVAYFGDLHASRSEFLSKRGRRNLRLFTAIGHGLTVDEFSPDVTYCFVKDEDFERGSPLVYGFLSHTPFLYNWPSDPYPKGKPGWVCSLRRSQYPLLMAGMKRLIEEASDNTLGCS
jgi:hypothetical protein